MNMEITNSIYIKFFIFQASQPVAKRGKSNPQVYLDIKIGNKSAGRITILLRADVVPMTAGTDTSDVISRSLQV